MATDFDRQTRAGALIPTGPSEAQSIFKSATCLAYADGVSIVDAIDFGTEQARATDPAFTPLYEAALLALE